MKTLIVEDDSTSRLILTEVLRRHGSVVAVVNGQEALERFSEAQESGQPFDLVTLDIMMPLLDGQDSLQKIRACEGPAFRAKIIMTTALDDPTNRARAAEGRCDAYLVKPIRTAHLMTELQRLGLVEAPPPR